MNVAALVQFLILITSVCSIELDVGKNVPFQYGFDEEKTVHIYVPGMVIDSVVIQHCIDNMLKSKDECIKYGDFLSSQVYHPNRPSLYTPSRFSSPTIEDMFTQRYDIIEYLRKSYDYQSYLEIGCDKNQSFGQLRDKFAKGRK